MQHNRLPWIQLRFDKLQSGLAKVVSQRLQLACTLTALSYLPVAAQADRQSDKTGMQLGGCTDTQTARQTYRVVSLFCRLVTVYNTLEW